MWADRVTAGRELAAALKRYEGKAEAVLGIPRGGVVIAYEIAAALGLRMDIVIAKKIGAPGNPELAIGAVAEDGTARIDQRIAALTGADAAYLDSAISALTLKIKNLRRDLSGEAPLKIRAGATYILADDGIATGATVFSAVEYIKKQKAKVVVAAPVCAPDTAAELAAIADDTEFLITPAGFGAVGAYYYDFKQVEDEEVRELIKQANESRKNG
jgi:putative phosphoribosyl transferase